MRKEKKIRHLTTIGLIIYFFMLPFEYPLSSLGSSSILRYAGMIVILLAIIDMFKYNKIGIDYRTSFLLGWLIYGAITLLWVKDIDMFIRYYSIYMRNTIMFLAITQIKFTLYESEIIKKSVVYSLAVFLIYIFVFPDAIIIDPFQSRMLLKAGNSFMDPNYISAIILIPYVFVFYKLINDRDKLMTSSVSILFCTTCLVVILLTGSRSGFIALGVVTLLCLNLSRKKNIIFILFFLLLLLLILPLIIDYLPSNLLARFSLEALTGQTDESGSRLVLWSIAIQQLRNFSWLFGYGIGSSEMVIGSSYHMNAAIHNHYLAQLIEIGIIGLALNAIWIIKMFKELYKKQRKSVLYAGIGIMISSIFLDVLTTKFYWEIMMLLSIEISSCRKQESSCKIKE